MSVAIVNLAGTRLPTSVSVRRISGVPTPLQDEDFHAKFDATTLLYDCVYSARAKGYLFSAPAFENLWPVFRDGLHMNGDPVVALSRKASGRCDQVFLRGPAGAELTLQIEDQTLPLKHRVSIAENFDAQNLLIAINKDNDLSWIEEWATYHARVHGATGAVLFDNGSSAYSLEALSEAFAGVPGFKKSAVVSAPYPYGFKLRAGKKTFRMAYLQTAVINIARRDFGAQARAVLSCDIDEMVLTPDGSSVFDAAVASRLGGFKFSGSWVYPENVEAIPCAQHAHLNRVAPDNVCHPKWCARANGLLSQFGWNVHSFGGRMRAFVPINPRFSIAHCAGTTTGWKASGKRFKWPSKTKEDPTLQNALSHGRLDAE